MFSQRAYILKLSVLAMFIAVFSVLNTANAGFFYFGEEISMVNKQNSPKMANFNTQNIQLLESSLNYESTGARGGGDITVVNNNSLLPDSGPLGTIADIEDKAGSDQISLYMVREGDSLSHIAKMFGVSINTIRWANNLTTSTVIRPEQTIMILPIDSIRHTVAKDETLSGIVKKYGGDLEETLAFNGWVAGHKPEVETVVIIPNGEGEPLINSGTVSGSGGPSYVSYYIRPVNGGRISQGLHGRNAKDFAIYCGAPIIASARGAVIVSRSSGWNGGYGLYVVIAHPNGTQTLYSHMSSIAVSVGWNVAQGQVIGYVGSTGRSTGCHVHFEVRETAFPNI